MKSGELYLDTTYVMPFFYLDIDVKGFSRADYKEVIRSFDRIHFSEISIIEAKAKCQKMEPFFLKALSSLSGTFINIGLSLLYLCVIKDFAERYLPV